MAGHLYAYTTQSTAAAAAAATSLGATEAYYPSSLFLSQPSSHLASLASWSSAVAAAAAAANSAEDASASGVKRSSEALYQQTVLGSMSGHEAWYSTDALTKRLRYENASSLPVYPQRPGEKDCAHYMLTRTCKFGESCKFDHPIWVPEGGIPEWKEVPPVTSESLPERPGELDCPYFLKTQRCKFGLRCRFNHPKSALDSGGVSALPDRPSETPCAFYLKTGICKFGSTCKFDHPKDIQLPLAALENGSNLYEAATSVTPAMLYNSKDLPIRPGEADCPFYLKTGSCKYGITCRYSHPDRNSIIPPAVLGHALMTSPATAMNLGIVNPVASLYQTMDPRLAQAAAGMTPTVYPQRPGQMECDFYMKTGECKFGIQCKYNHPIDRSAPTLAAALQAQQQSVKLTLAGLPRREGSIICPYYLKTGTCKYGPTCKFDHPPPGEVMAKGGTQETTGEEAKEEEESGSE